MSKQTKKALREAAEKAALRQRVRDIACGAAGYDFDKEDEFATAGFLERFVCALKATFGTDGNEYLWKPHCLSNFDTIETTTNLLWKHRNTLA